MLNPLLIEQQGLTDKEVKDLEAYHEYREALFESMEKRDPSDTDDLAELRWSVGELERLEFAMQRGWRFEEDASMHSWWFRAPHCKCPKLDNADPLMTRGGRIITEGCPLHAHSWSMV